MKTNSFVLLLTLLIASIYADGDLGVCSTKALFNDYTNYELRYPNSDVTKAYNGPASCVTLKPDQTGGTLCCYVKLKYKYEDGDYEETFTQKGCMEIEDSVFKRDVSEMGDSRDFDDFKKEVEETIEKKYYDKITVKKLSIDCNSKFLHLTGMMLLFFFL